MEQREKQNRKHLEVLAQYGTAWGKKGKHLKVFAQYGTAWEAEWETSGGVGTVWNIKIMGNRAK